jgi:hypothetical protein
MKYCWTNNLWSPSPVGWQQMINKL